MPQNFKEFKEYAEWFMSLLELEHCEVIIVRDGQLFIDISLGDENSKCFYRSWALATGKRFI